MHDTDETPEVFGPSDVPDLSDLLIIIPAWNEAEVIGHVLDELMASLPDVDVLVVSDGSTDDTARVARSHGATTLELPINLGVGGAMRAGYLYALRGGYSFAAQLDADGQHDPADLPLLLGEARDGRSDVVVGARFAGKGEYKVSGPRKWAMRLMSVLLSPVVGARLTDTTSGFKVSNRRAVEVFSREYPAEYLGDTIGALVLGAKAGISVSQVPVEMRARLGGEPSHGPFDSARFLLRAWFAMAIAMTRPSANRQKANDHA